MAKKRPEVLHGKTPKFQTACGNLYLTLNEMDGELAEVKVVLGKSGSCVRGLLELIGILLSIILQLDLSKKERKKLFERHLIDVNCGSPFFIKGKKYESCIDLISEECLEMLKHEKEEEKK